MEEDLGEAALRERLRHVYWIGGGSGAGKSAIARRIADRCGFHRFSTDDAMSDHARRLTPRESPLLAEFLRMDMDERWVTRPPEVMFETFHGFRGEGFDSIVEDLLGLPAQSGVIVEGFRLLPALVKPLLAARDHAVWLLPTADFRRAAFESRGSVETFLARTSDPSRALRNLLERDRMFTDRLREQASALGLATLDVDVTMTEADVEARVLEVFGR